jgi:hyaluronoglucosaminidase
MKNIKKNIFGYIEGYYGKLLNWDHRKSIIKQLNKNNMNYYFYAPKSDHFHRQNWKIDYPILWYKEFAIFCKYANFHNIKVIAGISPGLDFKFENEIEKSKDFNLLRFKANKLLKYGANSISLLLDDIPNDFNVNNSNLKEGETHALLANLLGKHIKKNLYFVPRVYADELESPSKLYIKGLTKIIDPTISIFYSGKNIVSKSINVDITNIFLKFKNNRVIIWDNLYANDYSPRKFFVGPWTKRDNIKDIMINGTGMIKTDLLILDIVYNFKKSKVNKSILLNIYKKNKIPKQFFKISKYFYHPGFGSNPKLVEFKFSQFEIDCIDHLLWKWHSDLSREWYPFLMGLKQDLLIANKKFSKERIVKTQSVPLARKILIN